MSSGTSADGIDVAVADLSWGGPGTVELHRLTTAEVPWPDGLRARVLALLPPATTTARELALLHADLGQAMAAAAEPHAADADLLVVPGQTVHHEVAEGRVAATWQLADPSWVAGRTGLPVLSQLRASDVAAGGHGAPLASTLDALWLGDGPRRAALNLGGIGNVTLVGGDRPVLTFDTGPANCLLDVVAARASDGAQRYDVDGRLAAAGTVDPALLSRMLSEPWFALEPPRTTGRELFSAAWLDTMTGPDADPATVAATLVELTAETVARSLDGHDVTEVVASGGGVRNPVLLAALRRRLDPVPVVDSAAYGLDPDGKEALLWCLLGFLSWHGVAGTVPGEDGGAVTGAERPVVLGSWTPGRAGLPLPPPASTPARRLVLRDVTGE